MSIGTVITLIAAVLGSSTIAAIITAFVNSKRNRSQSETEARAQFSAEFDVLAKNLSDEIKRQDGRLDKLEETIRQQGSTIESQGAEIRQLKVQEWGLRRYVATLLDFIRRSRLTPPDPPHDLKL